MSLCILLFPFLSSPFLSSPLPPSQHFLLQFETAQVDDEILDEFPVTIRHKVSRALYRRVVEQCYLFNDCTAEFIDQIVSSPCPVVPILSFKVP